MIYVWRDLNVAPAATNLRSNDSQVTGELDEGIRALLRLETLVSLSVPKCTPPSPISSSALPGNGLSTGAGEDGNNFGVEVIENVLKTVRDARRILMRNRPHGTCCRLLSPARS